MSNASETRGGRFYEIPEVCRVAKSTKSWYNRINFRCFKEDPLPEWISVKEAAEYTGYSQGHIRYLLGKGEVEGRKFGRDWFTTKKALDAYLATNPRPGPKSEKDPI